MKTKFTNAYIITLNEAQQCLVGDVVVEDNLITWVGDKYDDKCDRVIDCTGKILMPGFVDAHCHLTMSLFRNLGENTTFKNWWYDVMRPMEAKLTPKDYEIGVTLSALELLRSGVTTVADKYMRPDITAKVLTKLGLRANIAIGAITGQEVLDSDYLDKQCAMLSRINKDIKPLLYAHSIYSCDEDQFAALIKYAHKHNLVLTTHLSETLDEVGDCYNKYGVTPVEYLENLGFFDGTKTLLAHCVHCDKDDVRILRNYDISIVSNPSSNLICGSGIAPIYSFVSNKINVCLGTDGAGSNNSLNMFKEMFLLDNLQAGVLNQAKALTTYDTIKCATINGALALGYNNLGRIQRGYLADIILVDTMVPNMQPTNDNVCALVNSASASNVTMTMVGGKILYMDGKYTFDIDINDLYNRANKRINDIRGIAN